MVRWASLGVAAVVLTACTSDSFICLTDEDCGTQRGSCELNGYCSFVADECASGRRFGESNPPSIAGKCVPVEEAGTESSATSGTLGTSSSSTTLPDPSTGSSSGSTSTTSAVTSTTADSTTGSTSSSTLSTDTGTETGEIPLFGCGSAREILLDTFDDDSGLWFSFGPLDPEFDGTLNFDLDSAGGFGFGGILSSPTTRLAGVVATAELVEAPNPDGVGSTFFELARDEGNDGTVSFAIGGGRLRAQREVVSGTGKDIATVDFDHEVHRWFRIAADGDDIVWLTSADGASFDEFARAPFPNDLDGWFVSLVGLEGEIGPDPGHARWDDVSYCNAG